MHRIFRLLLALIPHVLHTPCVLRRQTALLTLTMSRTAVSMATLGAFGSMLGSLQDGNCSDVTESCQYHMPIS